MQIYLENSIKITNIVLIQKPYINNNYITILYLAFNNIVSNCIIKLKVIIFVKKNIANHIIIISRPNIYQNSDVQILNIFRHDLLNILLFNVYNKK